MPYAGFYINLDRRPDLQAEMQAELARHGLADRYARYSAADGNALKLSNPHIKNGEMGCFTSHYLLLKQNLGSDKHIHIIEDDVIFGPQAKQVLDSVIGNPGFDDYDIVYTDVFVPLLNDVYKGYKKFFDRTVRLDAQGNIEKASFTVINLRGIGFGSTSSYFVNRHSIGKLHDLYAAEITSEPKTSNDLFIRRKVESGELKVGVLFPFITSVKLDHITETTIEHVHHKLSALAVHMARYAFYIGADRQLLKQYMAKFPPPPATDYVGQTLGQLLLFSLTGDFESF
jgi:GR25 family glycosyltransferase involved in LPS biosynthesis